MCNCMIQVVVDGGPGDAVVLRKDFARVQRERRLPFWAWLRGPGG
jgi:hypothetical protein